MQGLLLLNFIVPFVMILVGYLIKKHPEWDMESQNGYNTPTSRKSQAHWDYADIRQVDLWIFKRNSVFASYFHPGCGQCGNLCGSRRSALRIF